MIIGRVVKSLMVMFKKYIYTNFGGLFYTSQQWLIHREMSTMTVYDER